MDQTIAVQDINKNTYFVPIDELSWRPSVYAIIIKNGAILLSKENNTYSLPGGGVVLGESLAAALEREVKEETGVNIRNIRPLSFASTFFALDDYPKTEHKQYIQSIQLFFTADYEFGDISLDFEAENERGCHAMAEWVQLNAIGDIAITSNYDWRVMLKDLA